MLGASGALALTIGGAFAVLLLAILDVREATRLATSSAQTLAEVNQLERLIVELEDGERGFVLTHGEAFLGPWQDAQDTFPAQADALA